jgi:hypothetical protein
MEQQIPQWLDAAIAAAGMTMVYNADDWSHAAEISLRDPFDTAANDPTAAPH